MTTSIFSEGALSLFKQRIKNSYYWCSVKKQLLKISQIHRKTPVLESLHLYTFISPSIPKILKICKRASVAYCHIKTLILKTGALSEIFQSRGGFIKLWHFDKHFVRNKEKGPVGKNVGVFYPRYSWTIFRMEHVWRKDSFIFALQILAIETAIEWCSNNSSILQKAVWVVTAVQFRFCHIIFHIIFL